MKKYIITIIVACAAAVSCMKEAGQGTPVTPAGENEESRGIAPGKAIVLFSDEMAALIESGGEIATKAPGLGSLMDELGIESMKRVFPDAGEFEERHRREGLHRFYTIKYKADVPVTKAMDELSAIPGVIQTDPVRKIVKRGFNDPYFSRQWHYVNTRTPAADIHVQEVWENYTTGSSNVIVSVVDEPVDPSHPDLQSNLWKDSNGHTGYNFVRGNTDLTIRPENGNGDVGHGTHVAGTIAAVNNNGTGLCGIAGGDYAQGIPGVQLMSCAIFSGSGMSTDDQTCNAFTWSADHGAVISQNSWGYDETESSGSSHEPIDAAMKAAIDYFIKYAGCDKYGEQLPDSPMKGGLVIFAAGNVNKDYDIICSYDAVIAVGAYGPTGGKASYSNYGSWVDIAAPGGEGTTSSNSIWSTLPKQVAVDYGNYVTVENTNWYGGLYWAGTSMACPHVSGVAALLVSYFGGPGFTADKCKEYLLGGAESDFLAGSTTPIGKKLNALRAFEYGIEDTGGVGNMITIKLSQDIPAQIHAHQSVSTTVTASSSMGNDVSVTLQNVPSGVSFNNGILRIDGPASTTGYHTFTIKATDNVTNTSATKVINYTILQNHAPVAEGKIDDMLFPSFDIKTLSLTSMFSDPDSETPVCSASVSDPEIVQASVADGKLTIKPLSYGDASVTVTASDLLGLSTSISFKLVVYDPAKPAQAYPVQISDEVNVRIPSEDQRKTRIIISTTSGACVHDHEYFMSIFTPIRIDMSKCAPGYYTVAVTYGGKTYTNRVVKL